MPDHPDGIYGNAACRQLAQDLWRTMLAQHYDLSPDPQTPDPREQVLEALRAWQALHGSLPTAKQLLRQVKGLPSLTTIQRYWPTLKACYLEV